MQKFRRGLWLTMLCAATSPATADNGLYLFAIPATLSANESGRLGNDILATLHVPSGEEAAKILGSAHDINVIAADAGAVTLSLGNRATLAGEPVAAHLAPSFVVDFDESAIGALQRELVAAHGPEPDRLELVEFVYDFIAEKNYSRAFDLASKVASTGEGDCTEHAVLLAALSRALKRPARVVFGVLLVEGSHRLHGFGHAWTEIYDQGLWHVADATIPEREAPDLRVFYLPILDLRNEGPGYAMDLARLARLQPSQVSEIGNAGPAAVD